MAKSSRVKCVPSKKQKQTKKQKNTHCIRNLFAVISYEKSQSSLYMVCVYVCVCVCVCVKERERAKKGPWKVEWAHNQEYYLTLCCRPLYFTVSEQLKRRK